MYTAMKNKLAIILSIALFGILLTPSVAFGQAAGAACGVNDSCDQGLTCGTDDTCEVPDAANDEETATDFGVTKVSEGLGKSLGNQPLITTITSIINVALSLLGIVAVVIVLIGGFKWMTAGGNDDKVTEGRKYITSGVIGIAIILSAWAVTRFVIKSLSDATGSGSVSEAQDL